MEFPVFFYQNNQIPTFLLFLPDPAEHFHIKWGQICMEGIISPPLIGIGLILIFYKYQYRGIIFVIDIFLLFLTFCQQIVVLQRPSELIENIQINFSTIFGISR